jgi:hypothetical protein
VFVKHKYYLLHLSKDDDLHTFSYLIDNFAFLKRSLKYNSNITSFIAYKQSGDKIPYILYITHICYQSEVNSSQSLLHKVHLKHKQFFQNTNRFSYLFRAFGSLAHKDIWNTWHYNLLAMNVPDVSKRQRKAKGQSITDNSEKLVALNI